MSQKYVDVEFDDILATTPAAILFLIGDEEKWIPRSQIEDETNLDEEAGSGVVAIAKWFAKKEGFEFDD